MRAGLYIHFPFCLSKCPYCHFYSVPYDSRLAGLWRTGLQKEIQRSAGRGIELDTLYIGGGTPSLLRPGDIAEILSWLEPAFGLALKEVTLEANPCILDAAVLSGWKEAGITRLSIGVQSFDDRLLRVLGRNYSARDALDFIESSRKAGFKNINLDMMLGIPGESRDSLGKSLDRLADLRPEHISLYMLENLEGLPFEAVMKESPVDDDGVADSFRLAAGRLKDLGLCHYEISNFAAADRECLHNLKYWMYEPFLGIGPSACSHLGDERWCNREALDGWSRALESGEAPSAERIRLDEKEKIKEALVFGLRLVRGIDIPLFNSRFGTDIIDLYRAEIRELQEDGLLTAEGGVLRIPEDKLLVSNAVLSRFV
ncbi:MAG TPA: radical SAM family heme chaperone HemW [Candidatus Aminicenantes bacterium]|nr:radical SAM family heme chaperone HemW [Candidatus Aminicenantes bacterium]